MKAGREKRIYKDLIVTIENYMLICFANEITVYEIEKTFIWMPIIPTFQLAVYFISNHLIDFLSHRFNLRS